MGINGKFLTWIEDFLSDRHQRVSVNGSLSRWLEVLSGIPQGSVLGPVLFILYINDLPGVISSFCMLFADDTKLYNKSNTTRDEHNILQNELNSLMKWAENWQLQFNIAKCKVMHYGPRNQGYDYNMGQDNSTDTFLQVTTEEKDLCVLFTRDLKFSEHIAMTANKANRVVGAIRPSFRYMDKTIFIQLYKSLLRGHLEYENIYSMEPPEEI